MDSDPRSSGNFWPVAILLAAALGIGFCAWWFPRAARERIARNERNASAALKMVAIAEIDFRTNDRDRNGVQDFWTGDVSGLHHYDQLIGRDIAAADSRPLAVLPPPPIPFHGYLFTAIYQDGSVSPPEDFLQDTDGKSGKVHHRKRFAFCAYPAEYGVTGRATFLIIEDQTLFQGDTEGKPVLSWPKDREMTRSWCIP